MIPTEESPRSPLSHGQRALWFLHLLAPASAAYHIVGLVRVEPALDPEALRRTLALLVRRHPVLAATFHSVAGEPRQRVAAERPLDFRAAEASELEAEASRPFDLERDPLLRVRLCAEGSGASLLLVVVHHIVADFWSLGVLMRELAAIYRQEVGGAPAALPPLARSYADYVRRQEEELAGPEGERLWSYWRERLGGALPALELPNDHPRPARPSFRGAARSLRLDRDRAAAVRAFGRSHKATLFATLLAAFQALLFRVTGQEDLLVGSPSHGRTSRAWAGLVGYFVNPVVIRADLGGSPSFAEHLERVKGSASEALAHGAFPFPLLAERLQPNRELSRSPIFQVMFILQKVPMLGGTIAGFALGEEGEGVELAGLRFAPIRLAKKTAQFDLTLEVAEGANGELSVSFEHSVDLFDGTTAERLLDRWAVLLAGAMEDAGRPLASLPLLTEGERHQLLVEWNDTGTAGQPGLLHAGLERQALVEPRAVALRGAFGDLTYGELDLLAARLAGHLRQLGVGPEVAVGVFLERSPEMVVALLGVLKAGGAYVPLDPSYPAERLAFLAADAGIRVVLTREALLPEVPAVSGCARVLLDGLDEETAWRRCEPLRGCPATPGNLAYLIYTSGSTGRPKGVAIEHRSASALLRWAGELYSPAELKAVLASTSINFDLSVYELFVPLSLGGTVVLVENALDLPRTFGVTLVNTVPSALAELLRSGGLPETVRTVNLAGEPLRRGLVEQAYAGGGVGRVLNLYGPSEDTTYSTGAWVEQGQSGEPTIGRPILGTRVYLVDGGGRLVPLGSAGELCLGGEGLARGYLGRPELTAERFVPDPFGGRPGERLYRTGDLARLRVDGELELLGRLDHQVKVRGYRVELGEVESALGRHPGLLESVVVAVLDGGERALAAYVVPRGEGGASVAELQSFLRSRLPAFMVPALFVSLPALPRTPNGKVDRKALPALEGGAPLVRDRPHVAPRTATEEVLCGIWAEVLGRERIGVEDNFFHLGGHSLKATQILARLNRHLELELGVQELFEQPTVAGLAARAEQAAARGPRPAAPPLTRVDRAGELPSSFGQERLWLLDRLEPGAATYHMPVALSCRGPLAVPVLASALAAVVARHEALRTSYAELPEGLAQRIAPPGSLPFPRVDLRALPAERRGGEVLRLAQAEGRRPFDLAAGSPIRAALVVLGEDDHLLLLTIHHIAADGRSLEIFAAELSALYAAGLSGRPARLPEPAFQYADFAAWQRRWLAGEPVEQRLGYWRERLQGSPTLALPTDRPRPALPTSRGGRRSSALGARLTEGLRELSRRFGTTLFMTLLAGFAALLSRCSGQLDLTVGTPVGGRNQPELEGVIGFFVNTLVLRADLAGEPAFAELLARTRETTIEGLAHQDLPFEKLAEALARGEGPGVNPLFQAMFALQAGNRALLRLAGLETALLDLHSGTAKFDLLLSCDEEEEGLSAALEHSAELFDGTTAERLLGRFAVLLAGAVADAGCTLSALPLLTAGERHQLLVEGTGDLAARGAQPQARSGSSQLMRDRPYVAPRTATEEALCGIWAEVLGRERIGVEDNFFHLGGHSLKATQILVRTRLALGVEIPLRRLLAEPTIADLARAIESGRAELREPPRIAALPRNASNVAGNVDGSVDALLAQAHQSLERQRSRRPEVPRQAGVRKSA
jgi:amino acid adenylation domain-containing protein